MIRIETDRLMIRESSGRDFSRIYAMLLSERVSTGNSPDLAGSPVRPDGYRTDSGSRDTSERPESMVYDISDNEDEELEKYLAYIHTVYSVFGFGLWSVVLKETGEVIGWCGLQPIGNEGTPLGRIELGYLIDREYRRRGYGHEACRAILDFAFGELEVDEVYAQIDEKNKESLRMAQGLGFVRRESGLWAAVNAGSGC